MAEEKAKSNNKLIIIIVAAVIAVAAIVAIVLALVGSGSSNKNLIGKWCFNDSWCYIFNEDKTGMYSIEGLGGSTLTYTDNGSSLDILFEGNDPDMTMNLPYTISEDGKTLTIEDSYGESVIYERTE